MLCNANRQQIWWFWDVAEIDRCDLSYSKIAKGCVYVKWILGVVLTINTVSHMEYYSGTPSSILQGVDHWLVDDLLGTIASYARDGNNKFGKDNVSTLGLRERGGGRMSDERVKKSSVSAVFCVYMYFMLNGLLE